MIISIRRLSTIHYVLIYMLIRTTHLPITALIYNYIHLWNALFTTYRSKCILTRFRMLFECAKHFECNTCLLNAIASHVKKKYFFCLTLIELKILLSVLCVFNTDHMLLSIPYAIYFIFCNASFSFIIKKELLTSIFHAVPPRHK